MSLLCYRQGNEQNCSNFTRFVKPCSRPQLPIQRAIGNRFKQVHWSKWSASLPSPLSFKSAIVLAIRNILPYNHISKVIRYLVLFRLQDRHFHRYMASELWTMEGKSIFQPGNQAVNGEKTIGICYAILRFERLFPGNPTPLTWHRPPAKIQTEYMIGKRSARVINQTSYCRMPGAKFKDKSPRWCSMINVNHGGIFFISGITKK